MTYRTINVLLVCNAVFQTFAFATGKMIALDAYNHYAYGDLRIVYVGIYLALFVIIAAQFVHYGRSFSKQNQGSLYTTVALVFAGVALQELLGGEVRVVYLSLALGAALLYIRNGEFFQLTQDKSIEAQRELLMLDDLTGIGNHRAYTQQLKEYESLGMPNDLSVFCIDINGLKEANDTLGHAAGDELIRAAANCVQSVFSTEGSCYRTGGDEFVVFARMDKVRSDQAMFELEQKTLAWRGIASQQLRLACGHATAADWPNATLEELVIRADREMYNAKQAYYRQAGRDFRKARDADKGPSPNPRVTLALPPLGQAGISASCSQGTR